MSMSLSTKDLRVVYKTTFEARAKWENVLLELGLSPASIKSIGERCKDDPDNCYREGLTEWLEGGQRSWKDLVEALSSPTVRHKDIAEEIVRTNSVLTKQGKEMLYTQPITGELVISINEQLGTGAFGTVFKGSYRGQSCAVKLLHHTVVQIKLNLPSKHQEGTERTFDRECDFLKSFQHPNIVQYLSTEKHPKYDDTILVIELMDCNLRVYFSSLGEESLSSKCQLSLSRDVASGLVYIHGRGIIHRDLCGDNILLKLAQPVPVAKISDFGMSRLLDPSQLSSTLTAVGHRMGYLTPEATRLEEEQYDYSLDVFSLGVIMVQIVHKLETVRTSRDRSFYTTQIPNTHVLRPLIYECLQEDKGRRPLAKVVCDQLQEEMTKLEQGPAELSTPMIRHPPKVSPGQDELTSSLTLQWRRRGKDMPFKMSGAIESVVICKSVYVGGGDAYCDNPESCTVMKLDLEVEQWTTLPQYSAMYFAMTSHNHQLTLIGGRDPVDPEKMTNQVSVFNGREWTKPYPPMKVARDSSTAVSFNNHIIVAGGWDENGSTSSTVEILYVTSKTWHTADPLPSPRSMMKSALLRGTLYIMGGSYDSDQSTSAVHIVDCSELIEKAISAGNMTKHSTPWWTIEDTPCNFSSPVVVRGSLLAIGGHGCKHNPSSSILSVPVKFQ